MDTTSTHYINYDPDEIWKLIQYTYISEGGDILYPGDEKEILLRSVLALLVQGFAIADNALLMDSLQHTMDYFMDIYGRKRSCYRIEAQAAEAEAEFTFAATMIPKTIPAGTAITADGQRIYLTVNDIEQTGYSQVTRVQIVAKVAGTAGNGLTAGTRMQLCAPDNSVTGIVITTAAKGGRDREGDEAYRERIQEYGLASVTTGPKRQYEQVARGVSTEVKDAKAVRTAPCTVCVYVIAEEGSDTEVLLGEIAEALSDETERPMTDLVTVALAEKLEYVLNVRCTIDEGMAADTIEAVIDAYHVWQDESIGRAFNPDKLMAMLYQAGVTRVQWEDGGAFNGGAAEYTEIENSQRCAGTINLSVVS